MESKFEPNSVIRNSVLNLVGQCVPLTVGLFCVPLIANGIGPERFGVLSLAWVLLASFSIFDLGMGRAVVKLVAEDLGKGQLASISPLVWSAILLQVFLGIAAGSLGFIVFHYWGGRIVHLPPDLSGEAITTFEIL